MSIDLKTINLQRARKFNSLARLLDAQLQPRTLWTLWDGGVCIAAGCGPPQDSQALENVNIPTSDLVEGRDFIVEQGAVTRDASGYIVLTADDTTPTVELSFPIFARKWFWGGMLWHYTWSSNTPQAGANRQSGTRIEFHGRIQTTFAAYGMITYFAGNFRAYGGQRSGAGPTYTFTGGAGSGRVTNPTPDRGWYQAFYERDVDISRGLAIVQNSRSNYQVFGQAGHTLINPTLLGVSTLFSPPQVDWRIFAERGPAGSDITVTLKSLQPYTMPGTS